ncbi:MAG: hypothetical protein RIT81_32025 [Deltaproteobacteria bacterium]
MNPQLKRYGWITGAVTVVAAGVYLVESGRLTGQADIHSQADIAKLGPLNEKVLGRLDSLVGIPAPPSVRFTGSAKTPEREMARKIMQPIEALGMGALASVASHFRDNGCVQPGSAAESALLRKMALSNQLTPEMRTLVAAILMDAATAGARALERERPPLGTYSSDPAIAQLVAAIRSGAWETAEIPMEPPADPAASIESCVRLSLDGVRLLLDSGTDDPASLFDAALSGVEQLGTHEKTIELVHVLDRAAVAANKPATELLNVIENQGLDDDARTMACLTAVRLEATPALLRAAVGARPPASVQRCLIKAKDAAAISAGLVSTNLEVRIDAAEAQNLAESDLPSALEKVYSEDLSPRERTAHLNAISETITKSSAPRALLAPVERLHIERPQVTQALARAMAHANAAEPTVIVDAPVARPALAASLERLATGSGEVHVASVFTLTERQATQKSRLAGAELDGCDVVLQPGNAQMLVDEAIARLGDTAIVCFREGAYQGSLEVRSVGLRLVAIHPDARLEGGLLLGARTTVHGLTIMGPVVVGAGAIKSELVGNKLVRGGVSATLRITAMSNEITDAARFYVPNGYIVQTGVAPSNL